MARLLMQRRNVKGKGAAKAFTVASTNDNTAVGGGKSEGDSVRDILIAHQKALMEKHIDTGKVRGKPVEMAEDMQRDKADIFRPGIIVHHKPWYMVNPRSAFKTSWDLVVMAFVLYLSIQVPLDLTFELETSDWKGHVFRYVNYLCIALFVFDMVLTFITCREDRARRTLIVSPKEIAKRYILSGDFFLDLMATFPFDLILPAMKPLRCLRILRMYRLMAYIQIRIQRPGYVPVITGIVFTFTWGILLMHFTTCTWVSLLSDEQKLIGGEYQGTMWDVYLRGVYWVVTTVTTVGYGDITPKTNSQLMFAIIIEMLGVAVYAFLVGRMTDSIINVRRDLIEYRDRMSLLNAFMQYRKYPKKLQRRIWEFHQYTWDNRMGEQIFGPALSMLSPALENAVAVFDRQECIAKSSFLKNLKGPVKRSLSSMMKGITFTPGQYVYRSGDHADSIYFVQSGEVHVEDGASGTIMRRVRDGDMFGAVEMKAFLENNTIVNTTRATNALTHTYCVIYSINCSELREMFNNELDLWPKLREHIVQAQSEYLVYLNVFEGLDDIIKSRVYKRLSMRCLGEGDPLYLRNDPAEHMYFVFNGVLTEVTPSSILNIHPGELCGDQEIRRKIQKRTNTVFVGKSAVVFMMSASHYHGYCGEFPSFRAAVNDRSHHTKASLDADEDHARQGGPREPEDPVAKAMHAIGGVLRKLSGAGEGTVDERRRRSTQFGPFGANVAVDDAQAASYSQEAPPLLQVTDEYGSQGEEEEEYLGPLPTPMGAPPTTPTASNHSMHVNAHRPALALSGAAEGPATGQSRRGSVEAYESIKMSRRRVSVSMEELSHAEVLAELGLVKRDMAVLTTEMTSLNHYREQLYDALNRHLSRELRGAEPPLEQDPASLKYQELAEGEQQEPLFDMNGEKVADSAQALGSPIGTVYEEPGAGSGDSGVGSLIDVPVPGRQHHSHHHAKFAVEVPSPDPRPAPHPHNDRLPAPHHGHVD